MDTELLHVASKDFNTTWSKWMELRDEFEFFDVTLACEGGMVKAHKVILSACSPVLKELIIQTQHPHPVLYLRGVKHFQVNSLLDFIYKGEVYVARDELDDFLEVAKELKVRGLTVTEDNEQLKEYDVNKKQELVNNIRDDDHRMKSVLSKTSPSRSRSSFISSNTSLNSEKNKKNIYVEPNIEVKENDESQIKEESHLHFDNEDISIESNLKTSRRPSDYRICQFCNKKVSKEVNAYKNHLEVVHGHVKVRRNLHCPYCFERKEDYKAWTICRQKHKNDQFWTYPSEFKCKDEDCRGVAYSGTSQGRKSFLNHNRREHGMEFKMAPPTSTEEELSCGFCKKVFATMRTLKVHEEGRCRQSPANNEDNLKARSGKEFEDIQNYIPMNTDNEIFSQSNNKIILGC